MHAAGALVWLLAGGVAAAAGAPAVAADTSGPRGTAADPAAATAPGADAVGEANEPDGWRLDLRVPMRDGVTLAADVRIPRGAPGSRWPTVLEFTPYGRGPGAVNFRNEADFWVRHGYAFAIVDTRGTGDSGGEYAFFRRDPHDGYDVVQWLAAQPWSDAKVGMRGASYTGANQWLVAKERPPALKCLLPNASTGRPFGEVPYMGGIFMWGWSIGWIASLSNSGVREQAGRPVDWRSLLRHRPLLTADEAIFGRPLREYRAMLAHGTFDEYWRPLQYTRSDFRRLAIPSFGTTGWFDGTLPGTVWYYTGMKRWSRARNDQYLAIGPWEHMDVSDGGYDYRTGEPRRRLGDLTFPDAAFYDGKESGRAFFDWCLKGGSRPAMPSARVWLTGSDRWLDLPAYPPASARDTPLYLASGGRANGLAGDGRLEWRRPKGGEDRFVYDPMDPVSSMPPGVRNAPQGLMGWPGDLSSLIDRPDVLVYLSAPLRKPLTILGSVRLVLHAASDARDTDFFSHIEDVAPDGRAIKLGSNNGAMLRARFRYGYDREVLLTPGEPFELGLDFFDIGHTFREGHRIRVSITSSAYPWAFPNPNTGNPIATDTAEPRTARQTVFFGGSRASRVVLPVIPTPPR